jgi:hypothetical protein
MADYFCKDDLLWIDDIGGSDVRVILLSLEPGSRFWLSLDGDVTQFERLPGSAEGTSQRACKPIGGGALRWAAAQTPPLPLRERVARRAG